MTVDITQEEMNILNLNGISINDVQDNIQYMRATGLDDDAIRQEYSNTIEELRPITKQSYNDIAKIKEYEEKGPITPFEYGQREAFEFDGTYDNIIQHQEKSARSKAVEERIQRNLQAKEERNKRVNEGTASFLDRAGAALDRWGDDSYQAQKEYAEQNKDKPYMTASRKSIGLEILNEKANVDKTQKIGMGEGYVNSFMTGAWIPFVGGYIKGLDDKKEREVEEKIRNGEPIEQAELDFINHRIDKRQEEATRGYTIGGKIAEGLLPSMIRFTGEIATGTWALKGLGLAGAGGSVGKGAYDLLRTAGASKNVSLVGGKIAKGLTLMGLGGTVNTLLPTGWDSTFEAYQERRLNKSFELTDKGTALFKEAEEKPAVSFMKSLGATFIMFASEHSGGLINIPVKGITSAATKYVGTPISQYVKSQPQLVKFADKVMPELSKLYEKVNGLLPKGKNYEFLKDMTKFDGFIEEMGEEVIEDLLNLTLGTGDEERTLDNYAKAVFKSPDEWAVLAGAIVLQGGFLSVASHNLGSFMEKNGASDDEIIEVLQNLTEKEKEQKFSELSQEGLVNIKEYVNEERQRRNELKNSFYTQNLNAGVEKEEALHNATIESESVANLANTLGMDINELQKEFGITVKNLDDEQAQRVLNGEEIEEENYPETEPMFQSINEAGVNNEAEIEEAKKEWQEKGTDSKYFKKWFGDSKVVDENGKPLVVYHGTENNFKIFKHLGNSRKIGTNVGFFFTDSKNMAKEYGNNVRVMPVYLSLKKPLIIEQNSKINMFGEEIEITDAFDFFTQLDTKISEQDIKNELVKQGYDGIILRNTNVDTSFMQDIHDVYVAFDNTQIKSVNNRGTFDRNNPNIYYQDIFSKEEKSYIKNFKNFVLKTLSAKKQKGGKPFDLGKTPKALVEAGLKDNPLSMGTKPLTKAQSNKNADHNIDTPTLTQVLEKLYNPIALIEQPLNDNEDTNKRRVSVILDLQDAKGKYVVVGIEEDKQIDGKNVVNDIRTIHSREDYSEMYKKFLEYSKPNKLFKIYNPKIKGLIAAELADYTSVGGRSLNDIINQDFKNFNLDVNKHEDFDVNSHIENTFGDSVENITESIKADIQNYLEENDIPEDEFSINDVRMYGSYTTGQNKESSDLDFLVEYSGSMSEDSAFNLFAEAGLKLTDNSGNEINVDINPIRADKSGTIDEFLERNKDYKKDDNVHFQSVNSENEDDRNLLMVHATKENNLDSILESGSLIAPSMAVINKDEKEIKFGDVIFIRNPKRIDYQNDNIHDRDIYSPRLPQADYMTSDGVFVSAYEYDSMERLWKSRPEKFKELYGNETFDEYFKGAKKVINMGFTPSGTRKTIPYNNQNLLNYIKKESLKGGENGNYGLSSLLARLAQKQTSKQKLKETAKENLKTSSEELTKKWDDIRKEYDSIGDKLAEYYFDKYSFYEVQEEVFYAIAKNNKRILNEYFADFSKIPNETIKEVKDFIEKAKSIPRSYFEAKPMQEVSLSEYSNVVAKKGVLTDEQKAKLQEWGVKPIEYEGDNLSETLEKIDKENRIFFQGEGEENDLSDKRGFTISRENFDGTMKDNLIVLLKNKTDKSTLLHEFAHVYLITLNRLALRNDKARELLNTVNKWLKYNGKEYTTKQHEKFANGFVAYVKAGKAPTYGLKRAFENFRRWLKDTFVSLEYNDGVEIDEDTRKVFDELLGNLSSEQSQNRIQEIIRNARNNANLRILEEDENRKVPINQLTDIQIRYRDTAYDILWYALSNTKNEEGRQLVKDKRQLYMLLGNDATVNKKNKGVMKQGEKLAEILHELDDVFSGGDGILPEWREFFAVPDEFDTYDADLATQAYDVITDRKYLRAFNANNYDELTEKDIQASKYELEYILDLYKNEKDKDNIVAAFFEWIDGVHPYIQEDILKEWELKTNEIDRYESLNKFEKAKEDLKLYAAKLKGYGDYSTQFAEYARAILKRLDFMTELDKAKMLNVLKDYNSFSEIERNLDFVMDYAQTLDDVSYRKSLADTIINEIKTTVPEKVNGTKKTKYDYRTNKLFERLRYLNTLSQEETQDLYDGYVNEELERRAYAQKEDGTINTKEESYFEDIENSFLQFKANGMYYNSTEMLETLLDKIQSAKFQGKLSRDEMDFEKRMEQRNWIDACAVALESHRGKVGKLEELYSMEANFDSILSMIFNDDVKEKFSLDDLYARVDGRVGKDRQEVLDKIAEVFGFTGALKGAKLNSKFIEMVGDRNYTIKQRYAQKEDTDSLGVWKWEPITLSRMEILYYYIQAKNPVSYQMLTDMGDETRPAKGQFDRDEFNELLTNLSDQEKLMGDILQVAAEKYYNDLNRYHINKHHIDMGKVTCYFPRKSEMTEVNELDLFNTYTEKSTNPKFVKMRTAGPSIRIAPSNPVNVLFSHIQKANTIIIMGEQLDLINKVFRDNDLKQKINSVFGETAYKEFMQHVTENLYAGQTKTQSTAEGAISKLMSNIIGAPIMIKPQIALKQMMSLINYGVGDKYVSTGEWIKEFGKVVKNPKAAIEFMLQDEYLKDRVSRGNLNEALKNQLENAAGAKLGILSEFFSLNMRMGDIAAIAFGGKAYVDVLMKKGYTREQAFEIFRKKTVNDQQSSINSTLSNLQRNSKNNPFAKLLFAYQNTPHQYFRTCANAVIKAKQGKISKAQAAKTIIIYWYLFPLMFNMATSLSPLTLIATGDPDELLTDMVISLLGNISCLPFFGEMARAVWSTITGNQYLGKRDWFSRANQAVVQPIKKLQKDELTFSDIIKSLEVFAQGAGIPLEEIDTQIEAIGDYAHGDFLKGAVKTLGYSRARADVVSGEK